MLMRFHTYVILVTAILLSTSPVFSEGCDIDPNECTPKNICEMTTEIQGGQKVWTSNPELSSHISFAKQLGMDCGASDPKDPCDLDANECKISELCERATIGEEDKQWNLDKPNHVRLAKEYSLSCDVMYETEIKKDNICTYGKQQNCNEEELCQRASWVHSKTGVRSWYSDNNVFVIEAKKRGLTCEAGEKNTNSTTCKDIKNLKTCSADELCQLATKVENGATRWLSKYSGYVKWAQKRGLSCGVNKIETATCKASTPEACGTTQLCELATTRRTGVITWTSPNSSTKKEAVKRGLTCGALKFILIQYEKINNSSPKYKGDIIIREHMRTKGTNYFYSDVDGWADFWESFQFPDSFDLTKNSNSVFPNLKREFVSLNTQDRKKIQQNLKAKGYYSSTIDGLWGRNTLVALVEYSSVRLRAIDLRSPNIVRILLDEVRLDYGTNKTIAKQGVLERVYSELENQKNIQNKSSAFKSSFLNQTQLKRKQIQYALNKLGYYRSGIDGLWGNGTKNALTSFASAEGLGSSTPSTIFSKLLSKVSVPSSFAAPKQNRNSNNKSNGNNKGWVALSSNPKLPFDDAREICEAKALAEGNSYLSANQPSDRFSSVNCYGYGSNSYSCRRSSGGGVAGGILRAWDEADNRNAAKKLAQAVAKACMADYGWIKR